MECEIPRWLYAVGAFCMTACAVVLLMWIGIIISWPFRKLQEIDDVEKIVTRIEAKLNNAIKGKK
jgi:hypothetical protein